MQPQGHLARRVCRSPVHSGTRARPAITFVLKSWPVKSQLQKNLKKIILVTKNNI
ncbi:hypothetical cytosolic protein [Syntrophus aciditrophicus SB]|uniref:Hypothetical cytosolic protein n=1 Tax=Syntrophus aciditrophicus (strain SB) TaxID=56780 RepID=Q2LUA2_SYNAS|nr:hypothetical cytosolic protein [Syntrophus aciditrophicus SB]